LFSRVRLRPVNRQFAGGRKAEFFTDFNRRLTLCRLEHLRPDSGSAGQTIPAA